MGAEKQCYNVKEGRADVLPVNEYEKYNQVIDKIE